MIIPALARYVAGLLADPDTGVNALYALVPKADDEEPTPPPCDVVNAMDAKEIGTALRPMQATVDRWKLIVRTAEEVDLEGTALEESGDGDNVAVLVTLEALSANGDTAELLVLAGRVLRCLRRTLHSAFLTIQQEGVELEGAVFTPPDRIPVVTLTPEAGTGRLEAIVTLPFTMKDTWALAPIPTPEP